MKWDLELSGTFVSFAGNETQVDLECAGRRRSRTASGPQSHSSD